ncbi:MAG TPA: hypothetical protein VGN73_13290 [Gemmatimonadaceae bacterium]|jgi:hypothetical protein|nr:hypothetical protein [Gemmatimonadaceae bacterium]
MPAHETLSLWENFYVIVGSSAGALTGLQFVVMALISDSPAKAGEHEINTFATPTIVHFCVVLLVSAIITSPWPRLVQPAIALWIVAAVGIVYTLIVLRRAHRTTLYQPVLEDWIWFCILPLLSYVVMVLSAGVLVSYPTVGLFGIGGAALLLLFVGIRNAWDSATYIAITTEALRSGEKPPSPDPPQE